MFIVAILEYLVISANISICLQFSKCVAVQTYAMFGYYFAVVKNNRVVLRSKRIDFPNSS